MGRMIFWICLPRSCDMKKMLILCAILLMEICSGVELPMVSGEY